MSKLCGWFGRVPDGIPAAIESRLRRFFCQPAWESEVVGDATFGVMGAKRATSFTNTTTVGWCAEKDYCIGFSGYITNLRGQCESTKNAVIESLAERFRRNGIPALAEFSGVFALVIYHSKTRSLTIATDRASLSPFYYTVYDGACTFGSEVKLVGLARKAQLSEQAVAERLLIGFTLGSHTLLQNVHRIPVGTAILCDASGVHEKRYWFYSSILADRTLNHKDICSNGAQLVSRAVQRLLPSGQKFQVLLSGGWDSRWIAAEANHSCAGFFKTICIHKPNSSKDAALARRLSRKLKAEHVEVQFRWESYWRNFVLKTLLVDGISAEHLWAVQLLTVLSSQKLTFEGLAGDGLFSGSYEDGALPVLNGVRADSPAYPEKWAESRKSDPFLGHFIHNTSELIGLGKESLREELRHIPETENRLIIFGLHNRLRNAMTLMEKNIWERVTDLRFPFVENDVVEFALAVPQEIRAQRQLNREMLQFKHPQLQRIPSTHDVRFADRVASRLRRAFGGILPTPDRRAIASGRSALRKLVRRLEIPTWADADRLHARLNAPHLMSRPEWNTITSVLDLLVYHNLFILERESSEILSGEYSEDSIATDIGIARNNKS